MIITEIKSNHSYVFEKGSPTHICFLFWN